MTTILQTQYEKDEANKKILVYRSFAAPLDIVWKAWTEKDILEKWWAPKPWKARTKSIQFETGGHWLYAMVGPNNECHWSKANYILVEPLRSFHGKDMFCDENGNQIPGFPSTEWKVNFTAAENKTIVKIELTFESVEQLQQLMQMGFEQGFAMAHENLDVYLKEHFSESKN